VQSHYPVGLVANIPANARAMPAIEGKATSDAAARIQRKYRGLLVARARTCPRGVKPAHRRVDDPRTERLSEVGPRCDFGVFNADSRS
jgi:hypothetical protein